MDGWVAKQQKRTDARACVRSRGGEGRLGVCATAQRSVSHVYLERPFFFSEIWIILRVLNQEKEYSNLREN